MRIASKDYSQLVFQCSWDWGMSQIRGVALSWLCSFLLHLQRSCNIFLCHVYPRPKLAFPYLNSRFLDDLQPVSLFLIRFPFYLNYWLLLCLFQFISVSVSLLYKLCAAQQLSLGEINRCHPRFSTLLSPSTFTSLSLSLLSLSFILTNPRAARFSSLALLILVVSSPMYTIRLWFFSGLFPPFYHSFMFCLRRWLLRRCGTLCSAREIASVALSAERKRHTENVFHIVLISSMQSGMQCV